MMAFAGGQTDDSVSKVAELLKKKMKKDEDEAAELKELDKLIDGVRNKDSKTVPEVLSKAQSDSSTMPSIHVRDATGDALIAHADAEKLLKEAQNFTAEKSKPVGMF